MQRLGGIQLLEEEEKQNSGWLVTGMRHRRKWQGEDEEVGQRETAQHEDGHKRNACGMLGEDAAMVSILLTEDRKGRKNSKGLG